MHVNQRVYYSQHCIRFDTFVGVTHIISFPKMYYERPDISASWLMRIIYSILTLVKLFWHISTYRPVFSRSPSAVSRKDNVKMWLNID